MRVEGPGVGGGGEAVGGGGRGGASALLPTGPRRVRADPETVLTRRGDVMYPGLGEGAEQPLRLQV